MRGFVPPDFKYDRGKSRKFCEEMTCHEKLEARLRKTLYYGDSVAIDRPSLPLTELAVDYFHSSVPRKLGSIDKEMASTMTRNACVSPCSVMMSMIYVRRLRQNNMDYLQQVSSSDLFFISMMMASKYLYDEGVDEEVFNDEWAESAKQELSDVNEMEKEFLTAMDWQLFVREEEFMDLVAQIEERIAWTQGFDRGWFTYSDLALLITNPAVKQMLRNVGQEWLKVITVGSTAYVAGIVTMIGATILAMQVSTAVTVAMTTLIALPPRPDVPAFPLPALPPPTLDDVHPADFDESNDRCNGTRPEINRPKSVEITQGSFFERVLPQLWAVMALREHFVQFVCAVSQSYKSLLLTTRGCKRSPNRSRCQSREFASGVVNERYKQFETAGDRRLELRIPESQILDDCTRCCPCCRRGQTNAHAEPMSGNRPKLEISRNLCSLCRHATDNCTRCDPSAGPRRWFRACYHGNRPPDDQTWDSPAVLGVMLGFTTSSARDIINVAA